MADHLGNNVILLLLSLPPPFLNQMLSRCWMLIFLFSATLLTVGFVFYSTDLFSEFAWIQNPHTPYYTTMMPFIKLHMVHYAWNVVYRWILMENLCCFAWLENLVCFILDHIYLAKNERLSQIRRCTKIGMKRSTNTDIYCISSVINGSFIQLKFQTMDWTKTAHFPLNTNAFRCERKPIHSF